MTIVVSNKKSYDYLIEKKRNKNTDFLQKRIIFRFFRSYKIFSFFDISDINYTIKYTKTFFWLMVYSFVYVEKNWSNNISRAFSVYTMIKL